MVLFGIFVLIILYMLYQAYKAGIEDACAHTSYRQAKCSTCENYNYGTKECWLGEDPNNCYKWEHSDDDYYLDNFDDEGGDSDE